VRDRDLIDAVLDEVYQALLRPALDDLDAITEAQRRVESLQEQFGGRRHYWPKPDKEPRNIAIASDLRATQDPKTVAAKHGVSTKTVTRAAREAETDNGGFGSKDWNIE
jgi:Mor family transcriptional regulator